MEVIVHAVGGGRGKNKVHLKWKWESYWQKSDKVPWAICIYFWDGPSGP